MQNGDLPGGAFFDPVGQPLKQVEKSLKDRIDSVQFSCRGRYEKHHLLSSSESFGSN